MQERWTAVDHFVAGHFAPPDAALDEALLASDAAGLPAIHVSPSQGLLLSILARSLGARRILEIGTLAAYSTIWLARSLAPGGRLVTLEVDEAHARVARANLARAGLDDVVELRLGRAADSLRRLEEEGSARFDFVFIDADKASIAEYFEATLRLVRPGGMILVDNVVREGAIADGASPDPAVQGVRRFHERVAAAPGVAATTIQTVGVKGYDGFTLVLVAADREARR